MVAKSKTIAIFIELLATSIVASSFFGLSRSFAIICIEGDLFSKPSSISALVREKKATSVPEIKAEHPSNTISKTILVISEVLVTNKFEIKTVGSGSKIQLD